MSEKLGFFDHLEELRSHTIRVVFVVFVLSLVTYGFTDELLIKVKYDVLGEYAKLVIVTTPVEAVIARITLSILLGAFVSVPIAFYELLSFVTPGLHENERNYLRLLTFGSLILFCLGAAFTYIILLPVMLGFLLSMAAPFAIPMLALGKLVSFITVLMVGMGIVFQWPLFVGVLTKLGLLNARKLSGKRRYAIVVCLILASVVTDPTFVTQIIVAVPMIVLYEFGIIVSRIVG